MGQARTVAGGHAFGLAASISGRGFLRIPTANGLKKLKIWRTWWYPHLVPQAVVSRCSKLRADARLFDYLVGACEQLRGHREIKQPRGLGIDDELKLRRLHRRQVGRSRALEDAADIEAD